MDSKVDIQIPLYGFKISQQLAEGTPLYRKIYADF